MRNTSESHRAIREDANTDCYRIGGDDAQMSAEQLYAKADAEMYRCKRESRKAAENNGN